MAENRYQAGLIKRIKAMLPECEIEKTDPQYRQGNPDLTIFHGRRWAKLEVKDSVSAPLQPNQEYYIEKYNGMSFAAIIFPENEEEVLSALQQALAPRRRTRVS